MSSLTTAAAPLQARYAKQNAAAISVVIILVVAAMLLLAYIIGREDAARDFHRICDKGQSFADLGPTDTLYRCTRVIDYPPLNEEPNERH